MRQYRTEMKKTEELEKIICNRCGREIAVKEGVPCEDVLHVEKRWGYFSGKDNRRDSFDLCETCYDQMVAGFQVQIEIED